VSIKVMARVWEHSRAAGTPLLVLLSLADFADDDGECWPSISTIARKCRLASDRHVQRVIHDELEKRLGEVLVIRNEGKASSKGGLRSNRYRITVHLPDDDLMVAGGPPSSTNDGGSQTILMVAGGPPLMVADRPPESSVEPSLNLPLNPQPKAGDHKPHRRGMRGTGTSPRELLAAEQQASSDRDKLAEYFRLGQNFADKAEATFVTVLDSHHPSPDEIAAAWDGRRSVSTAVETP
jgi:hypothetical protein